MKNILIVSDSFLNGGLENRLLNEITYYEQQGINVYLVCQSINPNYKKNFKEVLTLENITYSDGELLFAKKVIKNRNKICEFCKQKKIDFIECEPFFLLLPATLAAQKMQIPITYTLHGVMSGNFIDGASPNVSLLFYIILKYGFDHIVAVAEYLADLYAFLSKDIYIFRNGLTLSDIKEPISTLEVGSFAIASRLDSVKTQLVINFLSQIHNNQKIKNIDIYGDGEAKEKLFQYIQDNNIANVKICGWVNNLPQELRRRRYNAVFGMGKVVLDGITAGIPVGVLGYGGLAGIIDNDNVLEFAKTNLTSWGAIETADVQKAIEKICESPEKYNIKKEKLAIFNDKNNIQDYLNFEKSIKTSKKEIIETINRLLESNIDNTSYKVFDIICDIDTLITPNSDVGYNIRRENITLKNLINNYKEKSDKEAIDKIDQLTKELKEIKNSGFWKITTPLRKVLNKTSKMLKKNDQDNQIAAVLCVHNEEINIDGCLTHIEPFVDKIIIFDDKSTDKTIEIAKKHPKVAKIVENPQKKKWAERKNKEKVLREAYEALPGQSKWVLCADADERYEYAFLKNLRNLAKKYQYDNCVLCVHFRELWQDISHYRSDGIWNKKQKAIFFKLSQQMTFKYQQEHHIPWYYEELSGKEILLEYNLYHLKMIKEKDRIARKNLYKELDPNKKMQPIGYDYLTDEKNIQLTDIKKNKQYNQSTVPNYYKN